jgi:membrane-bound serine protease (ClpP class)
VCERQVSCRSAAVFLFPLALLLFVGYASPQQPTIPVVSLDGPITPMSAELVKEALDFASDSGTPVVLTINTPGGSLDATLDIIDSIEHAGVPVIGYVSPSGATAWSAGTYILLSTHVAAMAPHTLLGSAQPVNVDPLGGAETIDDAKVLNAMSAFLVERAKVHGRNETAARLFVVKNLNLSAEEALRERVVNIVSPSVPDLLQAIDGISVETDQGTRSLSTANSDTAIWSPSLRISVFQILSEPTVAYLLFLVGIYGLIFGLSSPGYGGEVVGAIMLVLGIMGLGVVGVNIGALILIGLGAILMAAEMFTHGFGLLGGGGFVSLVIGGFLLIPPGPWIVSQGWLNTLLLTVIIVPAAAGAFFIFAAYKVLEARRRKPFMSDIIGKTAEAVDGFSSGSEGYVVYQGEYWKARAEVSISPKEKVKIIGKDGPLLLVELLTNAEDDSSNR